LHTFCSLENCSDGSEPAGAPFVDEVGNVFGLTAYGGNTQCNSNGCGVLYQVTTDGTESVLYNFCSLENCRDGAFAFGGLISDSSGNIFGTTYGGGRGDNDDAHLGGGTVFKFSAGALETLYSFCTLAGCPSGEYPLTGVVMDSVGDLFGTTQDGGPN